jgi:hypothetical protein
MDNHLEDGRSGSLNVSNEIQNDWLSLGPELQLLLLWLADEKVSPSA